MGLLNFIDDSDDANNGIGNTKVQSPTHGFYHGNQPSQLCDKCKRKAAEIQKLQKKFEKLNKKYRKLCVAFAESQAHYNDLLRVSGGNTSEQN